jgi:hypothetical protein
VAASQLTRVGKFVKGTRLSEHVLLAFFCCRYLIANTCYLNQHKAQGHHISKNFFMQGSSSAGRSGGVSSNQYAWVDAVDPLVENAPDSRSDVVFASEPVFPARIQRRRGRDRIGLQHEVSPLLLCCWR